MLDQYKDMPFYEKAGKKENQQVSNHSSLRPTHPNRFRTYTYKFSPSNPFRIRTCTSLSKQTTYKPFPFRTYRHQIR
jgi:hypothetical protein